MSSRDYPHNDYPYQGYPYRSYPYTDYPYGSSGDGKGRAASRNNSGGNSPGSIVLSVLILAGFIFWLAFKVIKLIFRLLGVLLHIL